MPHTQTNEWDQYTKQQLLEAFTSENRARKQMNKELNEERRLSKQFEYEKKLYFDKWLRYHIKENVKIAGDMEEALDYYFNHKEHRTFMTPNGGYYCVTEEEEYLSVIFMWHNPKMWRAEVRDMTELGHSIAAYAGRPIRYTGITNVFKNHCKEISPGVWELDLHSS